MPWSSLVLAKLHDGGDEGSVSPVQSLDSAQVTCPKTGQVTFKLLTSGNDNTVRIWEFLPQKATKDNLTGLAKIIKEQGEKRHDAEYKKRLMEHEGFSTNWFKFRSELKRHERAVNCAKFSPNLSLIASASDDGHVIIWRPTDKAQKVFGQKDDEINAFAEHWQASRVCSGHSQDVIDIAWLGDDFLFTCGIDHKVQGFNIKQDPENPTTIEVKRAFAFERESAKMIQGLTVSRDGNICIAFTSDGGMHYFNKSGHLRTRDGRQVFCQDNIHQSMFRRAQFSPDGTLLGAPAGRRLSDGKTCVNFWLRNSIFQDNPAFTIKTDNSVIGVRWNQWTKYPFGYILAFYSADEVYIYKYNPTPETAKDLLKYVCSFKNLHYDALTDLAWVNENCLIASARDGFLTVLKFDLKRDFRVTGGTLEKPTIRDFEVIEHEVLSQAAMERMNTEERKEAKIETVYNDADLDGISDIEDSRNNSPEKNKERKPSGTSSNGTDTNEPRRSKRKNFGKKPKANPYDKKSGWLAEDLPSTSDESYVESSESSGDDETTQSDGGQSDNERRSRERSRPEEPSSSSSRKADAKSSDGENENQPENDEMEISPAKGGRRSERSTFGKAPPKSNNPYARVNTEGILATEFDDDSSEDETYDEDKDSQSSGSDSTSDSEDSDNQGKIKAASDSSDDDQPLMSLTKSTSSKKKQTSQPKHSKKSTKVVKSEDEMSDETDEIPNASAEGTRKSSRSTFGKAPPKSNNPYAKINTQGILGGQFDDDDDSTEDETYDEANDSASSGSESSGTDSSDGSDASDESSDDDQPLMSMSKSKSKKKPAVVKSQSSSSSKKVDKSSSKSDTVVESLSSSRKAAKQSSSDAQSLIKDGGDESLGSEDESDDSEDEFVEKVPSQFKMVDDCSNASNASGSPFTLKNPEPEACQKFSHGGATKPVVVEKPKARRIAFRTIQ